MIGRRLGYWRNWNDWVTVDFKLFWKWENRRKTGLAAVWSRVAVGPMGGPFGNDCLLRGAPWDGVSRERCSRELK
jgi:hypothetical protein